MTRTHCSAGSTRDVTDVLGVLALIQQVGLPKKGFKMSGGLHRKMFIGNCRRICDPFEFEPLEAALDGNEEAAMHLAWALRNDRRGELAVALWALKMPVIAYREPLKCVWDHDHQYVVHAAKTRRRLTFMFRYAAFPLPTALPETVRLWRGTSGDAVKEARKGYSWTTNRDTACWFAMRYAARRGLPLVLTVNVAKADIALFHDEVNEDEAVLMRPPARVNTDGALDDWRQGANRRSARIERANALFVHRRQASA